MKNKKSKTRELFGGPLTIKTKLPAKQVLTFAAANIVFGAALGLVVRSLFDLKKHA
ncbi:hypothetical protein [Oenococcus sicerae]|uniref:hypothetical protein n=1 Tax=Oenococcus sicerae TaxID=2203724 RepID=UPI002657F0EB|nr:hypothetical protein [Oenococcus sicerae]